MKIKKAMILLLFSMMLALSLPSYGLAKEKSAAVITQPISVTATLPANENIHERVSRKIALAAQLQSSRLVSVLQKITTRHEHISQDVEELQAKGIDVAHFMKLSALTQNYLDAASQYVSLPLIQASAQKQWSSMNRQIKLTVYSLKKATAYLNSLQKSLTTFYG